VQEVFEFRVEKRDIDIGYRARKLPFWIGRHGQLKTILAQKFLNLHVPHYLRLDISLNPKDVFFDTEWYRFLCRCRTVLGCEGGASLHDPSGEVRQKVEDYVAQNPEVSFDEVEQTCFPGRDGNLRLFALSPRHFECAITKSCQVLVEGAYAGIFKPGIHYIEIRKDWSNLEQVIRLIEDREYCEKIAENAYQDIVQSGLYTYRRFVETIINHVCAVKGSSNAAKYSRIYLIYLSLLDQRERFSCFFWAMSFIVVSTKQIVKSVLNTFGLVKYYYRLRGY
jgi:hypothetical protein